MYRHFYLLLIVASMLMLGSCAKDKTAFIEGTWVWVNVENINDNFTYEWEFISDGSLIQSRRSKDNISNVVQTGKGKYLLDTSPLKTTLRLIDTPSPVMNDRWDVQRLDSRQLIIKLNIEGGILYKEFIKKAQ
jgi:hypothetical protein